LRVADIAKAEKARVINNLMEGPDEEMRREAVVQAGEIGDARSIEILKPMIDASAVEIDRMPVYAMALNALGGLLGPEIIPTLLERLKDSDEDRRLYALSTLSRVRHEKTTAILHDVVLNSSDAALRFDAAYELALRGQSAGADVLLGSIDDPDLGKSLSAVCGLANLRFNEGLVRLRRFLTDPSLPELWRRFLFIMARERLGIRGASEHKVLTQMLAWVDARVAEVQ
jgi:HEAT repeat protein